MPHHPHPRTCTAPAGVSFVVQPGEKVGIVGRTGSGKSSLIVTLFRLVEPYQGSIVLDGRNLLSLGLDDVRGRIAAIPQVGGRRGWAAVAGGGRARGEGGGGVRPSAPCMGAGAAVSLRHPSVATLPARRPPPPAPPSPAHRTLCCSAAACGPTWTPTLATPMPSCGTRWGTWRSGSWWGRLLRACRHAWRRTVGALVAWCWQRRKVPFALPATSSGPANTCSIYSPCSSSDCCSCLLAHLPPCPSPLPGPQARTSAWGSARCFVWRAPCCASPVCWWLTRPPHQWTLPATLSSSAPSGGPPGLVVCCMQTSRASLLVPLRQRVDHACAPLPPVVVQAGVQALHCAHHVSVMPCLRSSALVS